jgi:hypothetical protein
MNERAKAIAARFRCAPAGADDPDVRACMERYLAAWGFPSGSRSTADRWVVVTDGREVVAVVGERAHPGTRTAEITDLYPGRGQNGTLGVYAVVEVLKHLVDGGAIDRIFWVSAAENKPHYRALKRVLGVEPIAFLWRYGGSTGSAEQTDAQGTVASEPHSDVDAEDILGVGCATLNLAFQNIFGRVEDKAGGTVDEPVRR